MGWCVLEYDAPFRNIKSRKDSGIYIASSEISSEVLVLTTMFGERTVYKRKKETKNQLVSIFDVIQSATKQQENVCHLKACGVLDAQQEYFKMPINYLDGHHIHIHEDNNGCIFTGSVNSTLLDVEGKCEQ